MSDNYQSRHGSNDDEPQQHTPVEPGRPDHQNGMVGVRRTMTEDQLHDHPEWTKLGEAINSLAEEVDGVDLQDADEVFARMNRSINVEVIGHAGEHRVMDVLPAMVPQVVGMTFLNAFISLWVDGFRIGQRFQSRTDAELMSATAPDTIEGLT